MEVMSDCKALIACRRYHDVQSRIKALTADITSAMSRCTVADTDYEKQYFDGRSCISRKLDWLKKERADSSNAESYYEVGTLEECDLCAECEKVPPLLKQRKALKLERGAALRSINVLGRVSE